MTSPVAVDTSVAVPLVLAGHEFHTRVAAWAREHTVPHLAGHALIETYSVLTRTPGDARVALADAVRLIDENFTETYVLAPESMLDAHR